MCVAGWDGLLGHASRIIHQDALLPAHNLPGGHGQRGVHITGGSHSRGSLLLSGSRQDSAPASGVSRVVSNVEFSFLFLAGDLCCLLGAAQHIHD